MMMMINDIFRTMINPFLQDWKTPFGTPPFDKIKLSHYKPAIIKAIRSAMEEIKAISNNPEPPDFKNTIAALERSGETIGKITPVLFNLNSAETSRELQAITQEISPLLTRFSNDITLNKKLFRRIREIYETRENSGLSTEQKILVERKYRNFILGGAGLKEKEKKRFREISEELATLSLKFDENVLEETNSFELHLTDKNDLAGLPENIIEMASMEAAARKKTGMDIYTPFPKLCTIHAVFRQKGIALENAQGICITRIQEKCKRQQGYYNSNCQSET